MDVRRLPLAVADLDAIWLYVAQYDPDAATRLVSEIVAEIERIRTTPYSGRQRLDLARDARSAPVRSFVIPYRIAPDAIEIVRIVHGHRRLRRLWRGAA